MEAGILKELTIDGSILNEWKRHNSKHVLIQFQNTKEKEKIQKFF